MKVFNWNDITASLDSEKSIPFFTTGTGLSVGSFDGLHLGHRELLHSLIENCRMNNLIPGVISFTKPLPSIKYHQDYLGDVTTLHQRLSLFEELGIQFAIIIDFNESFASLSGVDFLNIITRSCNMKFIAEGIDFRFGYKGATDVSALRYFALNNNIGTCFVNQVIFKDGSEEERVSSSYIRSMISKGFFSTVERLLMRPYEIEINENMEIEVRNNQLMISKKTINQVLPPAGSYHCKNETGEEIRIKITDDKICVKDKQSVAKIFFIS